MYIVDTYALRGAPFTSLQDFTTRIPKDEQMVTEPQRHSEIMCVALNPSDSSLGEEEESCA